MAIAVRVVGLVRVDGLGEIVWVVKHIKMALGISFGNIILKKTGLDISRVPGTGAAGGIAGSFMGLVNAQLRPGSDLVFDLLKVQKKVKRADYVITGEGQIDFQTPFGKGPGMLAKLAKELEVPVIGIAGSIGKNVDSLFNEGFTALFSIINSPMSIKDAISQAAQLIEEQSEQIARLLSYSFGQKKND